MRVSFVSIVVRTKLAPGRALERSGNGALADRGVGKHARSGIWHETYLVRTGEYEAL